MSDAPLGPSDKADTPSPAQRDAPPEISFKHGAWAVLLSLVVMGVIGYYTYDPDVFRRLVSHLRPWYLVAAFLTVVARVFFGGLRLYYVAHGNLTFRASMRGQLAWDFFSNVTPSAIGGAPVAAFYISRDSEQPVGQTTAFVLFAMLLDQLWFAFTIPLLFVASLFLEVFPSTLGRVGVWVLVAVFIGMLLWTLVFAYATLVRVDVLEKAANRLFRLKWLRRFQDRVAREMRQLRRRAQVLRRRPPRFFIKGFLMTGGAWISRYLTLLFIVWSVYTEADKLLILFRTMALMTSALVMPTPGGSGGIEGLYAFFIGPLIPEAVVAPTLITWRLLAYYLFIGFGVYLTMHQVRKTVKRDQDEEAADAPASSTEHETTMSQS